MPYSARERMPAAGTARPVGAVKISRTGWAGLAILVLVFMLWLAVSRHVYHSTLPQGLLDRFFDDDDADTVRVILRKAYSVIAFAVVGFFADKSLRRRGNRTLRAMLAVAAFSTLIELAQYLHGTREGLVSNAFDIACGALGGWLGVVIARVLGDRRADAMESARKP